jgi:hypothetical protein
MSEMKEFEATNWDTEIKVVSEIVLKKNWKIWMKFKFVRIEMRRK